MYLGQIWIASRLLIAAGVPGEAPKLEVGKPIKGEIGADAPVVTTPALAANYTDGPTRASAFRLVLPKGEAGPLTLDLVSHLFDAYLVVRAADGTSLAENDDGWLRTHAQLVLDATLLAKGPLTVEAAALHGETGPFELSLVRGARAKPDDATLTQLVLEDLRGEARAVEAARGPDSPRLAQVLLDLGRALVRAGALDEAVAVFERSLDLSRRVFGEHHREAGVRRNEIGAALVHSDRLDDAVMHFTEALACFDVDDLAESENVEQIRLGLAVAQGRLGRDGDALPQFEAILASIERRAGPDDPALVEPLIRVALTRLALGLPGVDALRDRALAIFRAANEPIDANRCYLLNNLATLCTQLGDHARARDLSEETWHAAAHVFGETHPNTLAQLRYLAQELVHLGRHDEARELAEQGLAISERAFGPDSLEVAMALDNVGFCAHQDGDTLAAHRCFVRSLALEERLLGFDHPTTLLTARNLTFQLKLLGEVAAAIELSERTIAAKVARFGAESDAVVDALGSFAYLLRDAGLPGRSVEVRERVLATLEQRLGPDDPRTLDALDLLGISCGTMGDWPRVASIGAELLRRAERSSGRGSIDYARGLLRSAQVARAGGDPQRAKALIEEAIEVEEKHPITSDLELDASLWLLGNVLSDDLDDPRAAADVLERRIPLAERVYGNLDGVSTKARALFGSTLALGGQYERAEPVLVAALQFATQLQGQDSPLVAEIRDHLGHTLDGLGKRREALEQWLAAMDSGERQLQASLRSANAEERLDLVRSQRHQLNHVLSAAATGETAIEPAALHERILVWKGQVARSLAATREQLFDAPGAGGSGSAATTATAAITALFDAQRRLSRLAFSDPADVKDLADSLAQVRAEVGQLELEVGKLAPAKVAAMASLAEVRAALPADAAAIDFVVYNRYVRGATAENGKWVQSHWGEARLAALVMTADRHESRLVDVGDCDALDAAVTAFLEQIESSRGAAPAAVASGAGDAGRLLSERLWAPLAPLLAGAKLVVISPDAFLGKLPFQLIPDTEGKPLIETLAIVCVQDLSALPKLVLPREAASATASLLVAGGVDYDAQDTAAGAPVAAGGGTRSASTRAFTSFWEPLRATSAEASAVARLHKLAFAGTATQVELTGALASEERVKEELPRARFVHLATHGFFEPEGTPSMLATVRTPEVGSKDAPVAAPRLLPGFLSGIVCAGANVKSPTHQVRDDGYLSAEELSWFDLRGVELVVLSACETGLGRPEPAEGLLGLRRTLRDAGVRTVISSLWKVDDEATCELMKRFYVNLWQKKQGKLEALRGAQLSMLHDGNAKWRRPAAWAAFVLDGAWN